MGVDSLRFVVCGHAPCRRGFLLCSRCDRGNRYCSRACSSSARAISLAAIRRKYEQSDEARRDRRDRARGYRARARARVTDHGSEIPPEGRRLPTSFDTAAISAPDATSAEVVGHAGSNSRVEHHTAEVGITKKHPARRGRCSACGAYGDRLRLIGVQRRVQRGPPRF